jgi:hypothetical protein
MWSPVSRVYVESGEPGVKLSLYFCYFFFCATVRSCLSSLGGWVGVDAKKRTKSYLFGDVVSLLLWCLLDDHD